MDHTDQELQIIVETSGMHPKAQEYFLKVLNQASLNERASILDFLRAHPAQVRMLCVLFKMKEIAMKGENREQWQSILNLEESLLNLFIQREESYQT